MGFGYLIVGAVFWFLPNFSIIDILPDFIGCLLFIKGLGKLADLSPGLDDAKRSFVKVLYIHLVKFVLMFTVPFFANGVKDGGYILIFSFTFAVLDLIFTLPAFKNLLNGFVYLGDRTNSGVIFKKQSELSSMTTIFIAVKAFLAMLPDLSYVSNPEYSGTVTTGGGGFYISNYKTLLVGLNFTVTGILGIVWLIWTVNYLKNISKDKELIDFLDEQYKTLVLPNKGLFIRRAVKLSGILIFTGGLFMFDLFVDSVNIIPDTIGALFFVFAAITLKKYCKTQRTVISSALFVLFSALSWAVQCIFAIRFPEVNILTNMDAYSFYVYVSLAAVLKYLSFATFSYSLYTTLNELITTHTGSPVDELEKVKNYNLQRQQVLKRTNLLVLIISFVAAFFGILRIVLQYSYPFVGVIDFAINAIYAISLNRILTSASEAVEYRYL